MSDEKRIYEFGEFRLDTAEQELRREDGEVLALPPKAFELLVFLVENEGRLLNKNELLDGVWADSFVEEGNLKLNIHTLRKTLGDGGEKFIETVPRRGYRFNAGVRAVGANELIVEKITQSRLVIEESDSSTPELPRSSSERYLAFGLLATAVIVFAVLAYFAVLRPKPADSNSVQTNAVVGKPTAIAVLPFKNLTKSNEDEFLTIGLTDALITRLSAINGLAVRPTSAVLPLAGDISPQIAGEKLQVENILEGAIQRNGKRLKISVQLVRMPENKVLWAKSLEEEAGDLLKIQDSLAIQIASALLAGLSREDQDLLAKTQTKSPDAFQLYVQGRYFWNKRTADDLQKSIAYFDQSKEKDPEFVLAYVGLADAYQLLGEYRSLSASTKMTRDELFTKSRDASRQALSLSENSAEAHTSLAYTLAFYDWNWTEAEREFKRAIEINPNYPTARQWFGEFLVVVGRFDEAYFEFRKAEELDPTSLIIKIDVIGYYYMTRQFDKSLEHAAKVIETDPKNVWAPTYQWLAYDRKGMEKEAAMSLVKCESLFLPPEFVKFEDELYRQKGWQEMWKMKLEKYKVPPLDQFFDNYVKALTAIRAGDPDETFAFLEKSAAARDRWFVNLKYDPQWDSLRSDPRFSELVRKGNLTP